MVLFAFQTKSVHDNETLSITISKDDFSKIFVKDDRIVSIKGQTSLYEIKEFKGEDEGKLFIKPLSLVESFSIFITTELGHHYTLQIKARDKAAETIEIKPITPVVSIATKWEQRSPYTEILAAMLRGMVNDMPPDGYAVQSFHQNPSIPLQNGLDMRLIKLYRGSNLNGEVWVICNSTRKTIVLLPKCFYKRGIRGVSFAREHLLPNTQTLLYRIVNA